MALALLDTQLIFGITCSVRIFLYKRISQTNIFKSRPMQALKNPKPVNFFPAGTSPTQLGNNPPAIRLQCERFGRQKAANRLRFAGER